MAFPVPTKSLLKMSPDAAMLFAPFGCTLTRLSLKRCDISQHNLVTAQNHAEDIVAPLTANVCITRYAALNVIA